MDPAPCRGCGAQMLIWESFCGMCGAPAPGFVDRREALEYSRSLLEGALASGRIPRDLFEWRARRLRVELETVDDPG
jgi:hypothetical protein